MNIEGISSDNLYFAINSDCFVMEHKTVKENHIKACTYLGFLYIQRQGTQKDLTKALQHTLDAQNGHIRVMINLAAIYQYRPKIVQDTGEVLEWYSKSVACGDEKVKTQVIKLQNNLPLLKTPNPIFPKALILSFHKDQKEAHKPIVLQLLLGGMLELLLYRRKVND